LRALAYKAAVVTGLAARCRHHRVVHGVRRSKAGLRGVAVVALGRARSYRNVGRILAQCVNAVMTTIART
jgi:hypothetical protein